MARAVVECVRCNKELKVGYPCILYPNDDYRMDDVAKNKKVSVSNSIFSKINRRACPECAEVIKRTFNLIKFTPNKLHVTEKYEDSWDKENTEVKVETEESMKKLIGKTGMFEYRYVVDDDYDMFFQYIVNPRWSGPVFGTLKAVTKNNGQVNLIRKRDTDNYTFFYELTPEEWKLIVKAQNVDAVAFAKALKDNPDADMFDYVPDWYDIQRSLYLNHKEDGMKLDIKLKKVPESSRWMRRLVKFEVENSWEKDINAAERSTKSGRAGLYDIKTGKIINYKNGLENLGQCYFSDDEYGKTYDKIFSIEENKLIKEPTDEKLYPKFWYDVVEFTNSEIEVDENFTYDQWINLPHKYSGSEARMLRYKGQEALWSVQLFAQFAKSKHDGSGEKEITDRIETQKIYFSNQDNILKFIVKLMKDKFPKIKVTITKTTEITETFNESFKRTDKSETDSVSVDFSDCYSVVTGSKWVRDTDDGEEEFYKKSYSDYVGHMVEIEKLDDWAINELKEGYAFF